ncbi:MAG: hypothetical protein SFW66_00260 [Gammaproteobacteria bacterium]|nr:hypothetical protein [Gammaproteobacteria bacterium]
MSNTRPPSPEDEKDIGDLSSPRPSLLLALAIIGNDEGVVKKLAAQVDLNQLIKVPDYDEISFLSLAIEFNSSTAVIKNLLDEGADPLYSQSEKYIPFNLALEKLDSECVDLMLQHIPDINSIELAGEAITDIFRYYHELLQHSEKLQSKWMALNNDNSTEAKRQELINITAHKNRIINLFLLKGALAIYFTDKKVQYYGIRAADDPEKRHAQKITDLAYQDIENKIRCEALRQCYTRQVIRGRFILSKQNIKTPMAIRLFERLDEAIKSKLKHIEDKNDDMKQAMQLIIYQTYQGYIKANWRQDEKEVVDQLIKILNARADKLLGIDRVTLEQTSLKRSRSRSRSHSPEKHSIEEEKPSGPLADFLSEFVKEIQRVHVTSVELKKLNEILTRLFPGCRIEYGRNSEFIFTCPSEFSEEKLEILKKHFAEMIRFLRHHLMIEALLKKETGETWKLKFEINDDKIQSYFSCETESKRENEEIEKQNVKGRFVGERFYWDNWSENPKPEVKSPPKQVLFQPVVEHSPQKDVSRKRNKSPQLSPEKKADTLKKELEVTVKIYLKLGEEVIFRYPYNKKTAKPNEYELIPMELKYGNVLTFGIITKGAKDNIEESEKLRSIMLECGKIGKQSTYLKWVDKDEKELSGYKIKAKFRDGETRALLREVPEAQIETNIPIKIAILCCDAVYVKGADAPTLYPLDESDSTPKLNF